jgi:hypothetical protein
LLVTAQTGAATTYISTVFSNPETGKEIGFTSYGFEQLVPPVYATISGHDLTLQVLPGTPVDSLYASFVTTDHNPTVKVGGASQTSGVTLKDFSGPVAYTLEADGKAVDYTVRVGVIK